MGMIGSALRALFLRGGVQALGQAGTDVIGALRPNATRQLELGHEAFSAVQAAHAAEFAHARDGWFDAFVNGLNRLPRPMLALGTLGLFVHAMIDPDGFARRMRGLAEVPEPLWWLLGAVVAFYFGARETHHLRAHRVVATSVDAAPRAVSADGVPARRPNAPMAPANPALRDWVARGDDHVEARD